jgi:L-rhamnose mutarotase
MKTFAVTIDLKPDPELIRKYLEYHKNVWPEVKKSVAKTGMRNVRIFKRGTRLFQVFDAEDDFNPRRDMVKYLDDPKAREWDEMMCQFQQPVPEVREGEWWAQMELVYDSNK